jgi:hypothetical protein
MDLDELIQRLQDLRAQLGNLAVFREEGFYGLRDIVQVVVQETDDPKKPIVILSAREN